MKNRPTLCLGSDHAGYALKEAVKRHLGELGYEVRDFGATAAVADDDYPDFVIPAAEAVANAKGKALGIVFGGSGIGECIAANKVRGIRAALIYDEYTASLCRQHNDANIICLGGRTVTGNPDLANKLVRLWLESAYSGEERHVRRLAKIERYEK